MNFLETIKGFLSPVFGRIPLSGKKRSRDEDEAEDMSRPETKKAQPFSHANLTEQAPAPQPEAPVAENDANATVSVAEFVAAASTGSGTAPAFGMSVIVQENWPLDKQRVEPHRRSALLQVQGLGAHPSPFAPVQPVSMLDRATHAGAGLQPGPQQPALPPRAQPGGSARPQAGSGPHAAPAVPGPRPAAAPALPPGLLSTPGGSSTPALAPGLGRGWGDAADTPGGPQPQRLAFDTPGTATQRLNHLSLSSPSPGPAAAAARVGAALPSRTPAASGSAPLYTPGLRPLLAGSAFEAGAAAAAAAAAGLAGSTSTMPPQQQPLPPPTEWRRSPGPAGLGQRPPLPMGGRSPAPSSAAAAAASPQPYTTTHQALALMAAAQAMQQTVSVLAGQMGFAGLAGGMHARQLALVAGTPLPQVPFARTFEAFGAELAAPGGDLVLGGGVARYLEQRQQQRLQQQQQREAGPAAAAVVREDGGYIGEDDESAATSRADVSSLTARLRQAAHRSSVLVHGPGSDGGAAAAAASVSAATATAAAQRARLSRTVEDGGAETLQMIGLKLGSHEKMVSQLRRTAQADTDRKVANIKAADEARRREQQRRLDAAAATAQEQQAAAAAAQAAAAAPARAAAAAPPTKRAPVARAPAPADEEEVLDLISSSDEEEEEAVEEEGEEEEGEEGEGEEGEGADQHNLLRPLTAAELDTWRLVMNKGLDPKQTLLTYAPNPATDIKLPRDKLQCLASATWLNDEVINLYMLLLQERDTRLRQLGGGAAANGAPGGYPRCHFFNSFFYNKLFQDENKYNYANVRRWTLPARLRNGMQASPDQSVLLLDRILLPVHQGVHWCTAELDMRARAVRYYDSLKGEDRELTRNLLQWVADESADKLKTRWDTSTWSVEFPKNIPTQRNGCDCGVFAIMFADRRGAGLGAWDFDQPDMELLRRRVLQRLIRLRVDLY
ncbi:hypothetical protein HXX76_003140 [Chlamydomonas incerta]|uniref:Ubiquitin-like protease family profile domain-containing protein n=1 Tax=Chlamydomonas incerta TaxID=51695 RepID=A0A835TAB6_CHLIN|nr:hypothetical protein HXX76_003140 [Chlamydomonas incerta]|eukprot:KAG2441518.1 hypothetical protein HXX76_003140 [Chlamydomonas incerta]